MDIRSDETDRRKIPNTTNNDFVGIENDFPLGSPLLAQKESQPGIDIRQALEILSSRRSNDHSLGHDKPLSAALKSMGQTIDLFAPSTPSTVDSSRSPSKSTTQTTATTSTNTTSTSNDTTSLLEKREKIKNSLKALPFIELLKMVLKAQEDRVRAYRLYDEALGTVLASNRLTDYPPACLAATAAFSVLSDTVSAVRAELSDRSANKKETLISLSTSSSVLKCITDLQESEREKLQLTAAYHLERIRANNLRKPNTYEDIANNDGETDKVESDLRVLSMLNQGIADLRSRIEICRSNISSIIEDLRCALVEQMEEEHQGIQN